MVGNASAVACVRIVDRELQVLVYRHAGILIIPCATLVISSVTKAFLVRSVEKLIVPQLLEKWYNVVRVKNLFTALVIPKQIHILISIAKK